MIVKLASTSHHSMMIRRQLYPYPLSLPHTDPPWRKALFLVNQTASEIYATVHLSRRFPVNMARLGREEGNDTGPPFVEDRDSSKAYKYDKFGEAYCKGLDEAPEPYLSRHGGGKDPYSNGNEESQQPYLSDYGEDNGSLRNGYGDYVHVYTDLASYSKWKLGYVTPSAYRVRDEPCEREEDMLRSKEMSELNASEESGENSISNAYTKKTEVLAKNLYEEREDTPTGNSDSSRQEDLHKEASLILDAYKVRAEEAYKKAERRDVEEYKNNRFERLMNVGCALLTEGEQGLDGGLEVGIAERMLKEASFIFASASSIDSSNPKPISALGNTLLTRGKLKLLLMEELREIIADSNANTRRYVKSRRANSNRKNQRVNVDDDVYQKGIDGSIRNMIPKVCDECEGLLVEAGRKYHALLLMNKRDEHAMFCWGQALFFRGRLVGAHDQKDAADDARKVYQASITKFEAVVALNKSYVPCAMLFRGLALQDQAWLYQTRNDEKVHLLKQAREVFEDVINAYPSYMQAKLAAAACAEDLKLLFHESRI